jgi:Secretion system C-terminal sorting domain
MKTFFTFLFNIIVITVINAQTLVPLAPGAYGQERRDRIDISANRDIIWSEDFADGLVGWENAEIAGVAQWEFRGPDTTPNVEVGSRGSCTPPETFGLPIASPSWSNGFVIFDSNWWDNSDNPCSPDYYGTGAAPAPHYATLTTPALDLSTYNNVALVFNHYFKKLTGTLKVEIAPDGVNWFQVYAIDETQGECLPDEQVYIQISPYTVGYNNVKIRFVFDGFYYHWQLDDIAIIDSYSNDLGLRNSTYGDFDMMDPAHPTGYEFMEYTLYPDELAPVLKFSSMCDNLGAAVQNDCRLNVDVISMNDNNVIHTAQSTEGFMLYPGTFSELRAGSFQMPSDIGGYKVAFQTSQTELEEFENNNMDTSLFFITDVQYARDALFTTAVYLGTPNYADVQYEVGNVFLITEDNLSCHSITVAAGIGSSTPANIYGAIYSFDVETGINATLIATTQSVALTNDMLNGYGDQILTNLIFDLPVALEAGNAYFVTVGSSEGVDNFVCAMSGSSPEATSFVRFFPSDWYYLDKTPMVRMNFGTFDNVPETQRTIESVNVFPVPANDQLQVSTEAWKNESFILSIYDASGRLIMSQSHKGSNNGRTVIDIEELSSGVYQLIINSEKRNGEARFVRE